MANVSRSSCAFGGTRPLGPGAKPRSSTPWIRARAARSRAAQPPADHGRFLLESIFHASPDTIVVRDITGQVVLGSSPLADVIGTTDAAPDTDADAAGDRGSGDPGNGVAGALPQDM